MRMKEERNLNICFWSWLWHGSFQLCKKTVVEVDSENQTQKTPKNLNIQYVNNCVIPINSTFGILSLLWSFYEDFFLSSELLTILSLLGYEVLAHGSQWRTCGVHSQRHLCGRPPEEPSQAGIQSTGEMQGLHWAGGSDIWCSMPSHAWFQMLHSQMSALPPGEGKVGGEEGDVKES